MLGRRDGIQFWSSYLELAVIPEEIFLLSDHTALTGRPGAQVWTPYSASGSRGGLDRPLCPSDPQSPHLDRLPKERRAEKCKLVAEAGQGLGLSSRDSDISILA